VKDLDLDLDLRAGDLDLDLDLAHEYLTTSLVETKTHSTETKNLLQLKKLHEVSIDLFKPESVFAV
jgi:hypothetical protein